MWHPSAPCFNSISLFRVQQLASINVSSDDVALLARELLLSTAEAEHTLKKHNGDAEAALRAFVAS
jgi:NACalpha-BTF3-like transcription factor